MIRKIIKIDEEKCNGCGLCAQACHEGAIAMIDGKAKLIRDDYCDGLGNCLPACPVNAISFIEREALAYNEEEVKKNMESKTIAKVSVPEKVKKKAALWHANNEIILALGGMDKVVTTTDLINKNKWFALVYPKV